MQTLLLIDGNAIMHRAFHALPPFQTKAGIPTNALYGFLSLLHKAINDFRPDYLVVCFDTPVPTFRKKIFKEYQIQRPKMEDGLKTQFPLVKQALDAAGVTHLEKEGFEADDLIGTISHLFGSNGIKVLILSGDKDILQLVTHNVLVITPQIGFGKAKIYDEQEVKNTFSIQPSQITDYKALAGDQSDNYKGAKGIGPKTASKLLNAYQSIEHMFRKLDSIDPKLREILKKNKKNILLSKELATILTNVKIEFSIEKTKFIGFKESLKDVLLEYEIYSLAKRFFKNSQIEKDKKNKDRNQISLFS